MGRNRQLQGKTRKLVRLLLIIATIMGALFAAQVLSFFNIAIYAQQYLGLFLSIAMIAIFLSKKPTDKTKTDITVLVTVCLRHDGENSDSKR